ncbi:MAG: hypothetical protein Q7K44_05350 [Candidatus Liptonbacteria bacterium]|nr:hypothetical protein [Candidatus Liptonbacteria bacterium]
MSAKLEKHLLLQDAAIIFVSILVAVILAKTEILIKILTSTEELEALSSFVAGMFFTSVFTTPLAMVTLGKIASVHGIISTAILGASGAVIGDLIIFRFIRDRLGEHLSELMRHQGIGKKFKVLLKLRYFRWFTFMLGGLIIASPLPDELGVSLLGFSKMRLSWFIPISFLFNFIGIIFIGIVAKTL